MRIIAGKWKGRTLEAPDGLATRPLPDRIKQSLFDWLGQDLSGLTVADVCAGSGGFGIEAASRGASVAHLIEPGRHAIPVIRANLRQLGDPPAIRLHPRPFQTALPTLAGLDLVFADPPFPWFADEPALIAELLRLAAATLAADGVVVIRGEAGTDLPEHPELVERERRTYGRSWISLLMHAPETPRISAAMP